ncbi:MAG: TetR/AcrR family transcriptional regulator [Chloroflexota bacterium]
MENKATTINGRKRKPTERSQKTQHLILNVAKQLISQHGFENTTAKDIAQAAGVAEGTVFLHFDNKQGIVNNIVTDFYERLQKSSEAIVAQQLDPFQKMRALIKNQLKMMEADWQLGRIIFGRHGRYVDNEFADEFYRLNRNYARLYIELIDNLKENGRIRTTTPSPLIRDTLLGSMEHFAISNFPHKRTYDLENFIDQLFDLVFFGCSQRSSG